MAIKITAARAKELLNLAGVQVAEIVNEGEDQGLDNNSLLSDIDKARMQYIKPQILQEVTESSTSAIIGKNMGKFRSALKRAFPELKDVPNSELDGMEYEDALKKAIELRDGKYGQDTAALRTEMEKLMQERVSEREAFNSEKSKIIAEWKDKYTAKEINEILLNSVLKDAPLPNGFNRAAGAAMLREELATKYHLYYDEAAKAVELRAKDNHELPVYLDEKKVSFKKPADAAKEYFEGLGLWQKDMRSVPPNQAAPAGNRSPFNPNDAGKVGGPRPGSIEERNAALGFGA
jgi:hypothetical protein